MTQVSKSVTDSLKYAIIPAGGLGTRFLPASAAVPKELFPVFDRPLIQYAIEELAEAGVEEIFIVVSPWKKTLFENFFNLKERFSSVLNLNNKTEILAKIKPMENWPRVHYVIQEKAQGLAQAISLCQKNIGENNFFVLLPDEVFAGKNSKPSLQLKTCFEKHQKSCVALYEVSEDEISNYGVASLSEKISEDTYALGKLVEKPKASEAPSLFMLPGRYLFTAQFWQTLSQEISRLNELGSESQTEIHITDALDRMAYDKMLLGQKIKAQRYDAGRPEGLMALSVFEAKNHVK